MSKQFEDSFRAMAHTVISEKAAPLQPYMVGFHLMDSNEEATRGVGAFGYRVGELWLYSFVFYLGGRIKGTDLLWMANNRQWVPQVDDWMNDVIGSQAARLGEPSAPVGDIVNKTPDLDFLSNGYGGLAGSSSLRNDWNKRAAEDGTARLRAIASATTISEFKKHAAEDLAPVMELVKNPEGLALTTHKRAMESLREVELEKMIERCPELAVPAAKLLSNRKVAISLMNHRSEKQALKLARQIKKVAEEIKSKVRIEQASRDVPWAERSVVITAENAGEHILSDEERKKLVENSFIARNGRPTRLVTGASCDSFVSASKPGTYRLKTMSGKSIDALLFSGNSGCLQALTADGQLYWANQSSGSDCSYGWDNKEPINGKSDLHGENMFVVCNTGPTSGPEPIKLGDLRVPRDGDRSAYILLSPDNKFIATFLPYDIKVEDGGYPRLIAYRDGGSHTRLVDFEDAALATFIFSGSVTNPAAYDYDSDTQVVPAGSKIYKVICPMNRAEEQAMEANADPLMTMRDLLGLMVSADGSVMYDPKDDGTVSIKLPDGTFEGPRKVAAEKLLKFGLGGEDIERILTTKEQAVFTSKTAGLADDALGSFIGGDIHGYPRVESNDDFVERPFARGQNEKMIDPAAVASKIDAESEKNPIPQMFDLSMIKAMLRGIDVDTIVGDMISPLMRALNCLGQLLFLYYWHNDSFSDRYGRDEMSELEDGIRNVFRSLGDLTLYLKQKSPTTTDEFDDLDVVSSGE